MDFPEISMEDYPATVKKKCNGKSFSKSYSPLGYCMVISQYMSIYSAYTIYIYLYKHICIHVDPASEDHEKNSSLELWTTKH